LGTVVVREGYRKTPLLVDTAVSFSERAALGIARSMRNVLADIVPPKPRGLMLRGSPLRQAKIHTTRFNF
jgi:hypothetical protein